mmetsp:Transcript_9896/g.28457  ORF Transcript_9896/g.28457 Transcript_9896/m.28457 type:complete len:397 (-) Transcript_9896:596-1786(-)
MVERVVIDPETQVQVRNLLPCFQLKTLRLNEPKFENIVIGFFMALSTLPDDLVRLLSPPRKPWADPHHIEIDVRENRFSVEASDRLCQLIFAFISQCSFELRVLNGLKFAQSITCSSSSFRSMVQRDGAHLEGGTPMSSLIQGRFAAGEWAHLFSRFFLSGFSSLELSSCGLGSQIFCATSKILARIKHLTYIDLSHNNLCSCSCEMLGECLKQFPILTYLNLSSNSLNDNGALQLCNSLPYVSALQVLHCRKCGFGKCGWSSILLALEHNQFMTNLNGFNTDGLWTGRVVKASLSNYEFEGCFPLSVVELLARSAKTLSNLDLSFNHLYESQWAFPSLSSVSKLQSLNMRFVWASVSNLRYSTLFNDECKLFASRSVTISLVPLEWMYWAENSQP